jgi:hypothetical protein
VTFKYLDYGHVTAENGHIQRVSGHGHIRRNRPHPIASPIVLARNVEDGDETIAVLDEYYMGLIVE